MGIRIIYEDKATKLPYGNLNIVEVPKNHCIIKLYVEWKQTKILKKLFKIFCDILQNVKLKTLKCKLNASLGRSNSSQNLLNNIFYILYKFQQYRISLTYVHNETQSSIFVCNFLRYSSITLVIKSKAMTNHSFLLSWQRVGSLGAFAACLIKNFAAC